MENLYSKKVLDHFFNPRNMGELSDADAIVRVGNPICGDVMEMSLKVGTRKAGEEKSQALGKSLKPGFGESPAQEYIEDIKFKTLGCGAAIATSSIATEMVKGKSLEEAEKLTDEAVAEALGGLPPFKHHCSVLAAEAVKKAIRKYRESKK